MMRPAACNAPPSCRARPVRAGAAALALLLAGCAGGPAAATDGTPPAPGARGGAGCAVDLIVRFSPRIAAPGSQAFVSELLAGTGYHLRVVRSLGIAQVLRLTGPDTTCEAGIAALRRDDRVQSVEVDERQYRHMARPE